MKKIITAICAFVLGLGTLLAQDGPPPMGPHEGPRLDELKSYLQLSEKQVQDIKALQSSFRDTVKPIRDQIMSKEKELRQEMGKASPDSSVVAQLMVDVKNFRTQIKAKRDELRPQLLALLTDAQKSLLANLQQALTLQRPAHEAAGLGLIDAPQNDFHGGPGFGRGWK